MSLPLAIYSVDSVRRIDAAAIAEIGSGYALMTRAGVAAVDIARNAYPSAVRWQVVCGGGNNGGDGYVVAQLAAEQGIEVSVLAVANPAKLKGDAANAYDDFTAAAGTVTRFDGTLDPAADLIIDALLGSGLDRSVTGVYADAVQKINAHSAPILALDMPSGLHGDSGEILGTAVQADSTITFVGLKSGLFLGDGPACSGVLHHSDLGISPAIVDAETPQFERLDEDRVMRQLQPRHRDAHKGDFGHVLIVGGLSGMPGAVALCGQAALRTGAGLVTIATHPDHSAIVAMHQPELMSVGVSGPDDLAPLLERATVVAIGPGLGTSDWGQALLDAVLEVSLPLIVDADALNLLADNPSSRDDQILTPHPGEAARLLDTDSAVVQSDRCKALCSLQEKYGGTVVLKGAGTLISGERAPRFCSAGNPGMAAPGMGDVLTGVIAALCAQGLPRTEAAAAGVLIHAHAGDRAAIAGQRGMVAGDLLAEIRAGVNP